LTSYRGTVLLVVLLLVLLAWNSGRVFLPEGEGLPAFFVEKKSKMIWIELGEGFSARGAHQFYDETALEDVMKMTPHFGLFMDGSVAPLSSGEALEIRLDASGKAVLIRDWMPASRRIALGVALHPDTMTREDWEDLPGIGPHLAEMIELDRHKNDEFRSYPNLKRVRGIGEKRLEHWREFFMHH